MTDRISIRLAAGDGSGNRRTPAGSLDPNDMSRSRAAAAVRDPGLSGRPEIAVDRRENFERVQYCQSENLTACEVLRVQRSAGFAPHLRSAELGGADSMPSRRNSANAE